MTRAGREPQRFVDSQPNGNRRWPWSMSSTRVRELVDETGLPRKSHREQASSVR